MTNIRSYQARSGMEGGRGLLGLGLEKAFGMKDKSGGRSATAGVPMPPCHSSSLLVVELPTYKSASGLVAHRSKFAYPGR